MDGHSRPLVAQKINLVKVGDASSSGYAMMASEPPVDLVKQAFIIHERWRFFPMPAELKDLVGKGDSDGFVQVLGKMLQADDVVVGQTGKDYYGPAGLNTKYAQFVFDAVQKGSLLATNAIKSQLRAKKSSRADIEIPALVQPFDDYFSEPKNFHLLWCRRWRNLDEHISLKEAKVALSSLRRSSRVAGVHGYRKLTLSNFKMNLVCSNRISNSICHPDWLAPQACRDQEERCRQRFKTIRAKEATWTETTVSALGIYGRWSLTRG